MFKEIPGYPGYIVNKEGVVKRLPYTKYGRNIHGPFSFEVPERELSQVKAEYFQVEVHVGGRRRTAKVHRLIALAFIPNPYDLPQVNHKDGNKYNNSLSNLEWSSAKENVDHSYQLGLACNKGERHPRKILSLKQVEEIKTKRDRGALLKDLGEEYGVSLSTIGKITTGVNWSCA